MQYQPIRPDARRDADAAKLAADGHTWPVYTLNRDHGAFKAGSVFYGVPSRSNPDGRWMANGVACLCPDYQQRGAMCAHVRAVRLFEAQRQQQTGGSADEADPTPTATRRPTLDELYPPCAAGCGDLVERSGESCYRCLSERTYELERESRRLAVAGGR